MQSAELRTLKKFLENDRNECAADIERIQQDLETKKADLARLDGWLEYVDGKLRGEPTRPMAAPTNDSLSSEGRTEAEPMTRSQIVASILAEAGKPLKIGEIIDRMEAKGYPLRGDRQNIYNSLYVVMKKAWRRFQKDETARWSLVDAGHTERGGQADRPPGERPKYIEVAEMLARNQGGTVRLADVADWFIREGYKEKDKRTHVMSTAHGALNASQKFRKGEGKGIWVLVSD